MLSWIFSFPFKRQGDGDKGTVSGDRGTVSVW